MTNIWESPGPWPRPQPRPRLASSPIPPPFIGRRNLDTWHRLGLHLPFHSLPTFCAFFTSCLYGTNLLPQLAPLGMPQASLHVISMCDSMCQPAGFCEYECGCGSACSQMSTSVLCGCVCMCRSTLVSSLVHSSVCVCVCPGESTHGSASCMHAEVCVCLLVCPYLWGMSSRAHYLYVCTQACMHALVHRAETLSKSLLWTSELTDPWLLFRPKKLAEGGGTWEVGIGKGRKGPK